MKVKGDMYCPSCEKAIAAVKGGHAVRNTIGAAATAGLALKHEAWVCPDCGGKAYRKATAPANASEARRRENGAALLTALLVVAIIGGVATHIAFVGIAIFMIGVGVLWPTLTRLLGP